MNNTTDLYVCGRNYGKERGAYSAVVCVFNEGQSWLKVLKCGDLTTNQSELKAVELALLVVNPEIRNNTITLITTNRYIQGMLERNDKGWVKEPQTNNGLIAKVRELLICNRRHAVKLYDPNNKHNQFLKKMLEDAVKNSQVHGEPHAPGASHVPEETHRLESSPYTEVNHVQEASHGTEETLHSESSLGNEENLVHESSQNVEETRVLESSPDQRIGEQK